MEPSVFDAASKNRAGKQMPEKPGKKLRAKKRPSYKEVPEDATYSADDLKHNLESSKKVTGELVRQEEDVQLRVDRTLTNYHGCINLGLFLDTKARAIPAGRLVEIFLLSERDSGSSNWDMYVSDDRIMTCSERQRNDLLLGTRSLKKEGACFANHAEYQSVGANVTLRVSSSNSKEVKAKLISNRVIMPGETIRFWYGNGFKSIKMCPGY
jgi:hypothetical protein